MPPSELSHIVKRIACHADESAFRELFEAYFNKLLLFAGRFLPNRHEAEEAVEDVFIRLWQQREGLQTIRHLNLYLYKAVKNTALNYAARNRRQQALGFDEEAVGIALTNPSPEELFVSAEALRHMQAAVDALPPQCRLVFLLVKEERLKYADVAGLLNLSVKTVETHMSTALARLTVAFHPMFPSQAFARKKK